MEKFRFDVELPKEDWEFFDTLLDKCHRNRKNMTEALILLIVKNYKSGKTNIDLAELGVVK